MIRSRIVALALAWPLLSAPAYAQRVLPLDPPIVVPPVSGRELRDAERAAERPTTPHREEKRLDETSPVARDNPGLGYDVTTGIQQRAIERALPR